MLCSSRRTTLTKSYMTLCFQCKHDFCWVCLEAWKKHSSATGGYFRCNRYEVVKKVGEFSDLMKAEVSCVIEMALLHNRNTGTNDNL